MKRRARPRAREREGVVGEGPSLSDRESDDLRESERVVSAGEGERRPDQDRACPGRFSPADLSSATSPGGVVRCASCGVWCALCIERCVVCVV